MRDERLRKAKRYGKLPLGHEVHSRCSGCSIFIFAVISVVSGFLILCQINQDYLDNKNFSQPSFTPPGNPFAIILFGIITAVLGGVLSRNQSLLNKQVRNDRKYVSDALNSLAEKLKARDALAFAKGTSPEDKLKALGFDRHRGTTLSDKYGSRIRVDDYLKDDIVSALKKGTNIVPSYTAYIKKHGIQGKYFEPEVSPYAELTTGSEFDRTFICSPWTYLLFAYHFQKLQASFLPKKERIDCSWAIDELMTGGISVLNTSITSIDDYRHYLAREWCSDRYCIMTNEQSFIRLFLKGYGYASEPMEWKIPFDMRIFRSSLEQQVFINAKASGIKANPAEVVEKFLTGAEYNKLIHQENTIIAGNSDFVYEQWIDASNYEFESALNEDGIKKHKAVLAKINIIIQVALDICIVVVPYLLFLLRLLNQSYCGAFVSQVDPSGNGTAMTWQQSSARGIFMSHNPFCSLRLSLAQNGTASQILGVECGSSELIGRFAFIEPCQGYSSKFFLWVTFLLTCSTIMIYFGRQYHSKLAEVKRLTLRRTSCVSKTVNKIRGLVLHTASHMLFLNTLTLFQPKSIAANFYVNRFGLQPASLFGLWSILYGFGLLATLVKKLNYHSCRKRPRTQLEVHIRTLWRSRINLTSTAIVYTFVAMALIIASKNASILEVGKAFIGFPDLDDPRKYQALEILQGLFTIENLPKFAIYSLVVIQIAVLMLITCCMCCRKTKTSAEERKRALELPSLRQAKEQINPLSEPFLAR